MKNSHQLAERFRQLLLDGKWIANTNYREVLQDVSLKQATKKVDSLNTIAALTFHVNYYIAGVLNVLKGGVLEIRDKFSFDMPKIQSAEDWNALVGELLSNSKEFADRVMKMSDEQLDEAFVDEKYGDYRRNIEGIIEHSYYHLGQIVLLKKLTGSGKR